MTPKGKPDKAAAPIPRGTDRAFAILDANGHSHEFSYWDLWFALVLHQNFDGDFEKLARHFKTGQNGWSFDQFKAKEKLSHLRDLQHRLLKANLSISALIDCDPELAGQEPKRARGRVLKHNERQYERSDAMRLLPADRKWKEILRGRFRQFPSSPGPTADRIRKMLPLSRCYSENASWGIVDKLQPILTEAEELAQRGAFAEAQGQLRGFITAVLELMECADDSFGTIGQTFEGAFREYLALPLAKTGISETVFFEDLLDLLVFEDYGLTDSPREGYFATLSQDQADRCIAYLRQQMAELKGWDLEHQTEEALTILGHIAAEQRHYDLFESLAREMEARHWIRIMRLADAAMKRRKRPLAEKVFKAALETKQGWHVDYLQGRFDDLKRGKWPTVWKRA